jgi:hypothetical protein
MKRILLLFCWLPALLFGQSEPLLHPAQIGAYTAPLNSFMRSTGTFAEWVSQSTAQAALNYWTLSGSDVYRLTGKFGFGTDATGTDRVQVDGRIGLATSGDNFDWKFGAAGSPDWGFGMDHSGSNYRMFASYYGENGTTRGFQVRDMANGAIPLNITRGGTLIDYAGLGVAGINSDFRVASANGAGLLINYNGAGDVYLDARTSGGSHIFRSGGQTRMQIDEVGVVYVNSPGAISGRMQVFQQSAPALGVFSGSSSHWTSLAMGRTAVEGFWGIAAGSNQFLAGSVAGDMVMRSETQSVMLGTDGYSPAIFKNGNVDLGASLRVRGLTTAGITKNDASGNISTTLPTVNLASSTVTMDYGSYIAKRKSTDEIRDEIGSLLWRKLTTGTIKRPGIVGNPTSWGQSEEWFDQSALRPAWAVGSSAGDVRHAASIEKEIIGDAPVANASSFTVGNNPYAFFQIADANSGTVNVTLDLTMLDGQEYTIACRRNATNAVIFNVPAGKQLDAQGGTALNDAPFTGAAHAIYTVSRIGEDNYIVK